MKVKTKISIALLILLFFNAQTAPAFDDAVACFYSDKLKTGNEFTWATTFLGNGTELDQIEENTGISNNTVIRLEILQNLKSINFHWDALDPSELNNYFNLTFGDNIIDLEYYEDIFCWWICWTKVEYQNGTKHNPSEDSWAYFVIDDFYFNRELTDSSIDFEGNVVTYNYSLIYPPSEFESYYVSLTYFGQIDRSNGIMLYFKSDIVFFRDVLEEFSIIFEILNHTPQEISWNLPIFSVLLITLPILLTRKRRKH